MQIAKDNAKMPNCKAQSLYKTPTEVCRHLLKRPVVDLQKSVEIIQNQKNKRCFFGIKMQKICSECAWFGSDKICKVHCIYKKFFLLDFSKKRYKCI